MTTSSCWLSRRYTAAAEDWVRSVIPRLAVASTLGPTVNSRLELINVLVRSQRSPETWNAREIETRRREDRKDI